MIMSAEDVIEIHTKLVHWVADTAPADWRRVEINMEMLFDGQEICLLYTSPSPRDRQKSRMPSSA